MILIFRELISAFSMALENIRGIRDSLLASICLRLGSAKSLNSLSHLLLTIADKSTNFFEFSQIPLERSETKSPPISLRINKIILLFSFFFLFLSFSPTLSLRFRIYVIPFPGKERRDPNYLSLWTRRTFHGRCTPETRSSSPNSCRKVIPGQ